MQAALSTRVFVVRYGESFSRYQRLASCSHMLTNQSHSPHFPLQAPKAQVASRRSSAVVCSAVPQKEEQPRRAVLGLMAAAGGGPR